MCSVFIRSSDVLAGLSEARIVHGILVIVRDRVRRRR
jgi:hypothetical protein